MDYDLEWPQGMDANLAWRRGFQPWKNPRFMEVDNVGMGERLEKYNPVPPTIEMVHAVEVSCLVAARVHITKE